MSQHDSSPGTYLLLLKCGHEAGLSIGKLGRMRTRRGYYLYVGSAFGPGGVRARVRHHAGVAARPHWHLDYLGRETELVDAWCVFDAHCEHEWAHSLMQDEGTAPALEGFGSSDCDCVTHLLYLEHRPVVAKLELLLGSRLTRVTIPRRD